MEDKKEIFCFVNMVGTPLKFVTIDRFDASTLVIKSRGKVLKQKLVDLPDGKVKVEVYPHDYKDPTP